MASKTIASIVSHHPKTAIMKLQNCILSYFDIPGRGEATRLALTIGGIAFEDRRVPFSQWDEEKSKTPWGGLPMLDLSDGSRIAQQRAVLRFVGAETGLYPIDDSYTCAKIDELMDAAEDLSGRTSGVGKGLGDAEKLTARKAACEAGGVVYDLLSKIDEFVAANGQNGHAVGDKLTIADLFVYTSCSGLVSGLWDGVPENAMDPWQNIQACRKMVRSHPTVAKYYEETTHKTPVSFGPM
jgi:prostaglandin-H2 D-isomerase / glutathione transferase